MVYFKQPEILCFQAKICPLSLVLTLDSLVVSEQFFGGTEIGMSSLSR